VARKFSPGQTMLENKFQSFLNLTGTNSYRLPCTLACKIIARSRGNFTLEYLCIGIAKPWGRLQSLSENCYFLLVSRPILGVLCINGFRIFQRNIFWHVYTWTRIFEKMGGELWKTKISNLFFEDFSKYSHYLILSEGIVNSVDKVE
jgi:hypothetical protein